MGLARQPTWIWRVVREPVLKMENATILSSEGYPPVAFHHSANANSSEIWIASLPLKIIRITTFTASFIRDNQDQ